MALRSITVRVSDEAARAYETAKPADRRKLDALVSAHLAVATRPGRSLEEIMGDMSRKARVRGLTPEILGQILDA